MLVSFEEIEANFAHGVLMPDSNSTLYPFGIHDEQLVHYTEEIVVENIIPGYLAISSNSKLARRLREIARIYNCVDIQKYDKIFLPNPNVHYFDQSIRVVNSLHLYFVGILCTDNERELLIKIV